MAKLTDLQINEVSLVDDPANPGARVILAKRKGKEDTMSKTIVEKIKDLLKSEGTETAAADETKTEQADGATEGEQSPADAAAELATRAETAEAEVAKLKQQVEALEKSKDQTKQEIEKAKAAEIEKVKAERDTAIEKAAALDFSKRAASEWPKLPGDEIAKGAVLKHIDGLENGVIKDTLQAMLKSGEAALANLTTETGVSAEEGASAKDLLDQEVKKYAEAKGIKNIRKAFYEFTTADPKGKELFKQSRKGN